MKLEKKRKGFATRLPIEIHEWLHSQSQKMNSSINSEIVRALQIVRSGGTIPFHEPSKTQPPPAIEAPVINAPAAVEPPVFNQYSIMLEHEPDGKEAPIVNPDFAITHDMAKQLESLWRELLIVTEVLDRYQSPPKAWLPKVHARKSHGVSLRSEITLVGDEQQANGQTVRGLSFRGGMNIPLKKDDVIPAIKRRHSEILAEMNAAQDAAFRRFTDSRA
jgi:hypothetical protein